jgi:protein MYSM1
VQPFAVSAAAPALAVMDMHAHMHREEVIGLLGGRWDPAARTIDVAAAFPCARAPGSLSRTSVELDPASEVAARAAMGAAGLAPVGWYHSHPIFAPTPSQKDAENQRNYQALFRDAAAAVEPFVGAIVGPYDQALPGPGSVTSWFVVAQRGTDVVPYSLRVAPPAAPAPPTADLRASLLAVAAAARGEPDAFDLRGAWRRFSSVVDGAPAGPPLTRAAKLKLSLARYVEGGDAGQALLEEVVGAGVAAGAKE